MNNKFLYLAVAVLLLFNLYSVFLLQKKTAPVIITGTQNQAQRQNYTAVTQSQNQTSANESSQSSLFHIVTDQNNKHQKSLESIFDIDSLPFTFPPEQFPYTLPQPRTEPPKITDSGITVPCINVTQLPQIDGQKDSIYQNQTRMLSPFYHQLEFSSVTDGDYICFFISFTVQDPAEFSTCFLRYDQSQRTYLGLDFDDCRFYDPQKVVMLDLIWENAESGLESFLESGKPVNFDLWSWNPGICPVRNIDDCNVKISRTVNADELLFEENELSNPFPLQMKKDYWFFGWLLPDQGIRPFEYSPDAPFEFNGPVMNGYSAVRPTGSCADIECRWTFAGKPGNYENAIRQNCVGDWTLEIKRKLDTKNPDDVRFDPAGRSKYRFFLPLLIPFYSDKAVSDSIYHPELQKNLGNFIPGYTLEFVK